MVASDWTMQCLSDILQAPVDRPIVAETTALGAAGLQDQKQVCGPIKWGLLKIGNWTNN